MAPLVLAWAPLSAAEESADEPPAPPPAMAEEPPNPLTEGFFPGFVREDFRGSLWTRYRLRFTPDESDQDFTQNLALDIGDPAKHGVTFTFLGEWSWDIDGVDDPSALYQIEDTFDSSVNGRLLNAYADLHRLGAVEKIRIGRQDLGLVPEVPIFDGAEAETVAFTSWKLRFHAFGGIPSHLYESSSDGDSVFGAGVETEPRDGTYAALTYAHIEDELSLDSEQADFIILDARQRILRPVSFTGRLTALEGDLRDLLLRLFAADAETGWNGQLSYFTLLDTQKRLVTELDPYYEILLEEDPYHDGRILVSKDMGENFTLTGEVAIRELESDSDEGDFNHEFRRYALVPQVHDWPLEDTEISVTGEIWDTDDENIQTYGFAISHEFDDDIRADLGTEYALYKFDPLLADELDHVRSVYLRGRYDIDEALSVDLRLEIERDDTDTYNTMRVGLLWRF